MSSDNKTAEKKILLVEDDISFANTLVRILATKKNYKVTYVKNGQEAKDIIVLEKFDIILSDIKMPIVNGIELLHFVKRTSPTTPIILMTGFAEITETKEAYELGAKGFLPKPFSQATLINTFAQVLDENPLVPEDQDDEFSKIRIDEFVSGKEVQFDIYIRINNTKYIKVANGGESIDITRVKKYHASGVSYLYLRREDFKKYTNFIMSINEKVKESNKIEHKKKVQVIQYTTKSVLENLYHNSLDKENYTLSRDIVETTVDMVTESADILEVFEMLKEHSDHIFAHSLAVSIYATMIARAIGWTNLKSKITVSMCGLFHDIGLKEIPVEIVNKSRIKRTPDETKIFETHTSRGMDLLNSIQSIPLEVSQVSLYHHEDCKGLGYPMHLTKARTTALSQLIYVANEFCDLVQPIHNQIGMSPDEAIKKMLVGDCGRFDQNFLNGLKGLIKH